jgi:hypothetical protein
VIAEKALLEDNAARSLQEKVGTKVNGSDP